MNASLSRVEICELWNRMAAVFGHRWLSSYGPEDFDDTWLRGLSGMTTNDLARGLADCVRSGSEWPPSLPLFRRLCLGLPDKDSVLERMLAGHYYADPVCQRIAHVIGSFDMRRLTGEQIEKRARRMYASAVEFVTDTALAARQLAAPDGNGRQLLTAGVPV